MKRQVPVAVLFAVLAVASVWGFLAVFAPPMFVRPPEAFAAYDRAGMVAAMAPEAVEARLEEVLALGGRYAGSAGFYRAAEYLREAYRAAGLEVSRQRVRTVLAQTEFSELLVDGAKVDVGVYPFLPNLYQPVATPDEGVSGVLVEVSDEVLREGVSFEGCFALIDASQALPIGFGTDYTKYVQLGFEGVVLSSRDGLDAIRWGSGDAMVTTSPLNVLRVAADEGIFDYAGREVTFRVRARFKAVPNETIVGVLKAGKGNGEALVIPVSYDTPSKLPDRAPGTIHALSPAIQLQLLEGLLPLREALRRDVIFVAFGARTMAHDPQATLVSALAAIKDRASRRVELEEKVRAAEARLVTLGECRRVAAVLDGSWVASSPSAPRNDDEKKYTPRNDEVEKAMAALSKEDQAFFRSQVRYVLDTYTAEAALALEAAKIVYERLDTTDQDIPEFRAYIAARKESDKAFTVSGLSLERIVQDEAAYLARHDFRADVEGRLEALAAWHATLRDEAMDALAMHDLFAAYENVIVIAPELAPRDAAMGAATETLTLCMGTGINHLVGGAPMVDMLKAGVADAGLSSQVTVSYPIAARYYGTTVETHLGKQNTESAMWATAGYPAYSLISLSSPYTEYDTPADVPWARELSSIAGSLKTVGSVILSAAFGNGEFPAIPMTLIAVRHFRGNVYVSGVGQSMIPTYPLKEAIIGCVAPTTDFKHGYYKTFTMMTDPYGRYERDYCVGPLVAQYQLYSPDAVSHDAQGRMLYVKDQGSVGQRVYASMELGEDALGNDVNIVTFHGASVTVMDMINPQTLNAYAGVNLVRAMGMSAFESTATFGNVAVEGVCTTFIPPDEYFFALLKAGSAENELVQTTRAFMLGEMPPPSEKDGITFRPGEELRGRGYLAYDTPFLRDVARDTAESMAAVNARRLAAQAHFGMADERTLGFQERAKEKLAQSKAPDLPKKASLLLARDAVTYGTLNHPVIRDTIFEAVVGVLFYLGLLTPFAFFFEKLVFGFADIRKQLSAYVIIFLTVFGLLQFLHPAFALIRSSIMILLGFVICMISVGIIAMFSSRFKENLEHIRQQRGQVAAAEMNKAGAIVTSFMLGLNNMHRRRVRTLLTCGTLVLITFVMICFTSVQNNLTDTTIAVGKAPYSGFQVVYPEHIPLSASEVFALTTRYGDSHTVVPRAAYFGVEDWESRERCYPALQLLYRDRGRAVDVTPKTLLQLQPNDPLAAKLAIEGRWYTKADLASQDDPTPVLISAEAARKLNIPVDAVKAGDEVLVEINGEVHPVCGIFQGHELDSLLDLNGESLLPFDIKALRDIVYKNGVIVATPDTPRIAGDDTVIYGDGIAVGISFGAKRTTSVAVVFPDDIEPKDARDIVNQYMEQSGRSTYFGLDDCSFLGRRTRERTFTGLIDMLIPLIIAAVTVLNTIRGSVYERKEEIFVYNAVGIAPRHIFFMFFAEAFVYAVVGSMVGYILSQGTGRLLTALDLTGGLNMTFTSLSTVYATLTIVAAVFISTWFPAKTAMKIASPGDQTRWRLPEPDGDIVHFTLPFTFDWRDRIAVLEFFKRYFLDHGEGSSGAFFTGDTAVGISDRKDSLNGDGPIPHIRSTLWLKPFDLGVSEHLLIEVPTDPETREFIAEITLTRTSGTLENWRRLNTVFVGLLRTQFLHWRAVREDERQTMFLAARATLES